MAPTYKRGVATSHTVDIATTGADIYAPELLEREQWMGRPEGKKLPFAPWADREHADATPGDAHDTDTVFSHQLGPNTQHERGEG